MQEKKKKEVDEGRKQEKAKRKKKKNREKRGKIAKEICNMKTQGRKIKDNDRVCTARLTNNKCVPCPPRYKHVRICASSLASTNSCLSRCLGLTMTRHPK